LDPCSNHGGPIHQHASPHPVRNRYADAPKSSVVNRRPFLAAGVALLAGCGSSTGDDTPPPDAATPTPGDVQVVGTDTSDATATPTETPTPTPTPSSTPTPTSSPTPTATPVPSEVRVSLGKWTTVPSPDTRLEARVARFDRTDEIPARDLRDEYRDDAPLEPPDGETWVEADVEYRNRGDDPATVSADAWTLVDLRDETSAPDRTAMERVRGTLRDEDRVGTFDGLDGRLVFATAFPTDLSFRRAPDGAGPTVRWVA
jgi:hypothetical protein